MAYAAGYDYDLFISYTWLDNQAIDERGLGYVSQLVRILKIVLTMRLGQEPSIFFDQRHVDNHVNDLEDITEAVRRSAVFLAVGSSGYLRRPATKEEFSIFRSLNVARERLLLTELLPLDEDEEYPDPLDRKIAVRLWRPHEELGFPMLQEPSERAYMALVHDLAERIRLALKRITAALPAALAASPPSEPQAVADNPKSKVFVAPGAPNLSGERAQLRRFLQQYDGEIAVLPRLGDPANAQEAETALREELPEADVFVQLLAPASPDSSPGAALGIDPLAQSDAARRHGAKIVQWCAPQLDGAPACAPGPEFLQGAAPSGFEAFKTYVVECARELRAASEPGQSNQVFVDADETDRDVATAIVNEFTHSSFRTSLPIVGASTEENRLHLERMLTEFDVLVFVYGEANPVWVRGHLKLFQKLRARRKAEPRITALCTVPPADRPDFGTIVGEIRQLDCTDGYDPAPVRALIRELSGA